MMSKLNSNAAKRPHPRLYWTAAAAILLAGSCQKAADFDAMGLFEADEVIISAEATGKLLHFDAEEGTKLNAQQQIGTVDCEQVALQKQQAEASMNALELKQNEAAPQIAVFQTQIEAQKSRIKTLQTTLTNLERERKRTADLLNDKAVTAKQYDDLAGQVAVAKDQLNAAEKELSVLEQQIKTQTNQVNIQNRGVMSERDPLKARVAQLDDQLKRCKIINPIDGTVLTTYANTFEIVAAGKPLYKIANLDTMVLRVYVSNEQFAQLKLNQKVNVRIDDKNDTYRNYNGYITWVSDRAEFTPKSIQTKNERSNLVYAVKINVPNDGFLKIGMFGEVIFSAN